LSETIGDISLGGMGSELSTIGLQVGNGVILEDCAEALRWPLSNKTYSKMSFDPTIASANQTIRAFIRNAKYDVEVDGESPTEEQKNQIAFIESCMNDLDTSFEDVINEALSFLKYGYSIHEKVFKFRNRKGKFKSKFDDGRVGWAKLPVRSQDSISRWNFDDKGRELLEVEQDLNQVAHQYNYHKGYTGFQTNKIILKRKKFLHFRHNVERNNPEGTSPLKACYLPWTYKSKIEEYEAIGVSRDLGGLPVISLPPEYMSADASDDKKAVYAYYKNVIRNLHANEQAGLILPSFIDPESKKDLFSFRLESVQGGKMYDTGAIISRYENKILMTYLADVLKLGQDASGSFALSDNKTNLLAVGIQAIIGEVLQEFNNDLIPQTLKLNGWDISKGDTPRIILRQLDDRNLDELGKYVQRVTSVGAVEVDENLSDWLRKEMKAPPVDRTKPIKPELVSGGLSKAGEGMKTGAENGTAKTVAGKDNSSGNTENS